MATFVEYLDESNLFCPNLTPIGYLNMNPEKALRDLLPDFYVVNYQGVLIPSKSEFTNNNQGLRISSVANGIGLIGTIEMLNQSELFRSCKHEPYSTSQKKAIVEKIKSRLQPWQSNQEPLKPIEAEKYSLIFDALGYPMSIDELVRSTTHENYFNPVPNRGILTPQDLPRFP